MQFSKHFHTNLLMLKTKYFSVIVSFRYYVVCLFPIFTVLLGVLVGIHGPDTKHQIVPQGKYKKDLSFISKYNL